MMNQSQWDYCFRCYEFVKKVNYRVPTNFRIIQ